MRRFHICGTCGHGTYRLMDPIWRSLDGSDQVLSTQQVFDDYRFGFDQAIALPA